MGIYSFFFLGGIYIDLLNGSNWIGFYFKKGGYYCLEVRERLMIYKKGIKYTSKYKIYVRKI